MADEQVGAVVGGPLELLEAHRQTVGVEAQVEDHHRARGDDEPIEQEAALLVVIEREVVQEMVLTAADEAIEDEFADDDVGLRIPADRPDLIGDYSPDVVGEKQIERAGHAMGVEDIDQGAIGLDRAHRPQAPRGSELGDLDGGQRFEGGHAVGAADALHEDADSGGRGGHVELWADRGRVRVAQGLGETADWHLEDFLEGGHGQHPR